MQRNKDADQLRGYHAADLHICFVHSMQKAEFLMARVIIQNEGNSSLIQKAQCLYYILGKFIRLINLVIWSELDCTC